jgi:hypothetical protein
MSRKTRSRSQRAKRKSRNAARRNQILNSSLPRRERREVRMKARRGDAAEIHFVATGVLMPVLGVGPDGEPVLGPPSPPIESIG